MVDVEGHLHPFRIDIPNFVELVSHISEKLNEASSPIASIDITVTRFKENCKNVDEMIAFLKDVHMPKVIKKSTLWIRGRAGLTVYFYFSAESATYGIFDAKDMNQARSMEDTITEFFRKYTTSRILSPYAGMVLELVLVIVALYSIGEVARSYLNGSVLAYRPYILLIGICAVVLSVYIVWSVFTAESPPFSFVHSIIYIDQPPNHSMWVLISTILIGIVISVMSNWIG